MKKLLVVLGSLLAASSALIYLSGREAAKRDVAKQKVSAAKAAALLAEAWADNHTRA